MDMLHSNFLFGTVILVHYHLSLLSSSKTVIYTGQVVQSLMVMERLSME